MMELATSTKDIHICGSCKQSFNDLSFFIEHKRSQCLEQPMLELVTTSSTEDTMGNQMVGLHPLYRVGLNLEPGHLTAEQETRLILQQLQSQGISGSLILRSRLLGSNTEQLISEERAGTSVSLDVASSANLIQEIQNEQSRRELQMDEEDVASLLANQLGNGVVCGVSTSADSSFGGELLSRASIARGDSASPEPRIIFSSETTGIQREESCGQSDPEESFHPPELPQDQYIMSEVELSQENLACQTDPNDISLQVPLPPPGPALVDRSLPRLKKQHRCLEEGCGFASCYLKDLARHMRKHTGERPFRCTTCSHMFTRADKLKAHQRIHDGIKSHVCTMCMYAAVDGNSLKKHMLVHDDKKPYKCQMCSYRSRTSSQLTVHLRTHTGDSPFVCPHESCTGAFKTSSDLVRHSRLHTGEKPYSCTSCDYACNIKSNLKVHIRLNHTQYKPVPCTICNHIPTSKLAAREHSKLHAADVIKCDDCSFSCVDKSVLKNHRVIHSARKAFSCKYCMYDCHLQRNLKRHMKSKHPDAPVKSGKNTDQNFSQSKESKITAASKLFCKKSFQCTVCNAGFVREDSWRCHQRQHKVLGAPSSVECTQVTRESMDIDETEEAAKYISPCDVSIPAENVDNSGDDYGGKLLQAEPNPQEPQSPNTIQILEEDSLSVIQEAPVSRDSPPPHPVYVYVTEGVPEGEFRAGELMTTPVVFSSPCGQYVTLPSQNSMAEQLSVSLQGGMQFVFSGSLASLVGEDTFVEKETSGGSEVFRRKDAVLASETFVHSTSSINFIETDVCHQSNSPPVNQAVEFRATETSIKKF